MSHDFALQHRVTADDDAVAPSGQVGDNAGKPAAEAGDDESRMPLYLIAFLILVVLIEQVGSRILS